MIPKEGAKVYRKHNCVDVYPEFVNGINKNGIHKERLYKILVYLNKKEGAEMLPILASDIPKILNCLNRAFILNQQCCIELNYGCGVSQVCLLNKNQVKALMHKLVDLIARYELESS